MKELWGFALVNFAAWQFFGRGPDGLILTCACIAVTESVRLLDRFFWPVEGEQ